MAAPTTEQDSPPDIGELEASAGQQGSAGKTGLSPQELGAEESSPGESLYKSGKAKQKKKRSWQKKAGISAGAAGLGGGMVLLIFFILPPLKLIHLAETLKLDMGGNESSSHTSINRLFRYAKTGELGTTRVSRLGEKIFSNARAQLADIGITFEENKAFGNLRTITVEPAKNPAMQGMTQKQAKEYLAREFKDAGISTRDITASGGKLTINSREVGIGSTRFIVKKSLSMLDSGRISTWLRVRNFTKFFNLPSLFHPWQKAQAKAETKLATRLEARAKEKERKSKTSKVDLPEGHAAETRLRSKFRGISGIAGGALLFTGVLCTIRDSADDAVTYNRDVVALQGVADATEAIAMGSQQQSGMDFTTKQVRESALTLTDADGGDVFQSKPLKAKTDPYVTTGVELPIEYAQAFGGTLASTLKNAGGTAAAAACSNVGQALQIVGGLALLIAAIPTGGGTAAVYAGLKTVGSIAVSAAVMVGLQHLLTDFLESEPFPDNLAAPIKGGIMAYGSREMANIAARSGGGVDLGPTVSAELDMEIIQKDQQEFQKRPLLARLFDVNDYHSLASRVIDKQSTDPAQQVHNMASSLLNFGSIFSNLVSALNPRKAAAAGTPYNWGFNRYGIPPRILTNDAYDDPYANAEATAAILSGPSGQDYIDRAKKCFGVSVFKLNDLWTVRPDTDVNPQSTEYEDAHCNQASDPNWDRMIVFVWNSTDMEAAACYAGDKEACVIATGRQQ